MLMYERTDEVDELIMDFARECLNDEQSVDEGTAASAGAAGSDRATFVAERDGQWIGLATGLAEDPEDPKLPGPVLVGMFVDRAERRRGVGVALVEAVSDWARQRGAARLSLWVFPSNEPGIALYTRCGFRLTGETKSLDRAPTLTELRMARVLP